MTALTIILTIPTIIGSLYGMNVSLPFEHTRHAFAAIVLVTSVIMAVVAYVFTKKEWM